MPGPPFCFGGGYNAEGLSSRYEVAHMHILKNFKNFADAELNLMRPMTLMIGRNGSGKSNVIEAVELLAQLAHGRPLYEITDIGRGSGTTFEIRGGLPGCLRLDREQIEIFDVPGVGWGKFYLGFTARWKDKSIQYDLNVGFGIEPQIYIFEEKLLWDGDSIFHAQTAKKRGDILDIKFNRFKEGVRESKIKLPSDRSVLSRYETFVGYNGVNQSQKNALALVKVVDKHLNSAFVFDINPKVMRNYERIGQVLLARDGSNLSSILYGLSKNKKEVLERILGVLAKIPDETLGGFDFVSTKLQDVILAFRYSDGSLVDARLLSDGTLRALAILTALETVPEKSRIIIEEMDNGIHPSRVKLLVDAIWECSHRRNLNVLVTTHNPATLDSLSMEQMQSVVVCYHDPETNSSKLTPLLDLPRADVLLERGRLGDLVTRRVLEQHLMPGFEEEQKRKALELLESIP